MICYYYPPLTDVGCKRSVAFAKYFKKHGWNPYVLSVKNPDKTYCTLGNESQPPGIPTECSYSVINVYKFFGKLNGLLTKILKPFGVELKRNYFYDIFCIPDIFFGWIPLTTLKGYKLLKKFNIDFIYISCTPFSSAVVGVLLKFITRKPLILDFRDAYALEKISVALGVPKIRIRINRWIEKNLLKHADIFIVTTNELRKAYIQQYPQVRDKTFTIHNGFDLEYLIQNKPQKYPKFTIVYTGEFYFYASHFNNIFFQAIALLKAGGKVTKENFQFLFYGDGKDRIEQTSKDSGIEDIVVASSRILYRDVLNVISKSHLQLLRIVKPMISTKLFEGIPLNTPFLAIIPNGEVEKIIKKYSPSSYIVTEKSPKKVADAILDAMSKYKNDEIQDNHVQEFLENFSRERLTLKLMKIIEQNIT